MKKKTFHFRFLLIVLFSAILWSLTCGTNGDYASENQTDDSVCAVLAHPDDESIISGTLTMLVNKGFDITVVYTTSGDDGPDETGRGLHGDELGEAREKEAQQALRSIGIKNPPVFLRFPDSHVPDHVEAVQRVLFDLFNEIAPQIVIGFGPDGITDDWDHKITGFATDFAFDLTDSGKLLLHMAISQNHSPFYARGIDVSEHAVNIRVNVAKYAKQRSQVVEAHHTQFNRQVRFMYKTLVHTMPTEKFIIARNRDAEEWLDRCFEVKE